MFDMLQLYPKRRASLSFLVFKQAELECSLLNVSYGMCCIFMDVVIYMHLSFCM